LLGLRAAPPKGNSEYLARAVSSRVVNAQADAPEAEAAIETPNRQVYINAEISTGHHNFTSSVVSARKGTQARPHTPGHFFDRLP